MLVNDYKDWLALLLKQGNKEHKQPYNPNSLEEQERFKFCLRFLCMFRVAKVTVWETTFEIAIEQICLGSSLVSSKAGAQWVFGPCSVHSCKHSHGKVCPLREW